MLAKNGVRMLVATGLLCAAPLFAENALQVNLKDLEVHPAWLYHDLNAGFAEALKSGRPLMVVFR